MQPVGAGRACDPLTSTQLCTLPDCQDKCIVGPWIDSSLCDATCANGRRTQTRTVTCASCHTPEEVLQCGETTQIVPCNTQPCARDCIMDLWSDWSSCSPDCGEGLQSRTRIIIQEPENGGLPCGPVLETRQCTNGICGDGCKYGVWVYGNCSVGCGAGTLTRTRSVVSLNGPSASCLGLRQESDVPCNAQTCPYDCQVSEWLSDGSCSTTCGPGVLRLGRSVTQVPVGAGMKCPLLDMIEPCQIKPCAPHCTLGEWFATSACTRPCGGGTLQQTRSVTCTECDPSNAVELCGPDQRKVPCNEWACPVDCGLTSWSSWSACSSTCGSGMQVRRRQVTQAAANGGAACLAAAEMRDCTERPCDPNCAIGPWTRSQACSSSCASADSTGEGAERYVRNVTSIDGKDCSSVPTTDNRPCNLQPCSIDCQVGNWQKVGDCSSPCGAGLQRLVRAIVQNPVGGGQPCEALEMFQQCSTQNCPAKCTFGAWENVNSCSAKCGGGNQTQIRSTRCEGCNTVAEVMAQCVPTVRQITCNPSPCPVDCEMSEWAGWSACSEPCGRGIQQRRRDVRVEPQHGGAACSTDIDMRECNSEGGDCPRICIYTAWQPARPCNAPCGGGVELWSRTISMAPDTTISIACPGNIDQARVCNTQPCDTNCVVSDWLQTVRCDVECGPGYAGFSRAILIPNTGVGAQCPPLYKVEPCQEQPCAPVCTYGSWLDTASCSTTCGGGTKPQTREARCDGCGADQLDVVCPLRKRVVSCNTQACPIDCAMSAWTEWTPCTQACGPGIQTRTRTVVTAAANGGVPCAELVQSQNCAKSACAPACQYSPWIAVPPTCSQEFGGGTITRTRNLTLVNADGSMQIIVPPASPPPACLGTLVQVEPCKNQPGSSDCVLSDFVASPCSAACGTATRFLTASVVALPTGNGVVCPDTMKIETCTGLPPCPPVCKRDEWTDVTSCQACGSNSKQQRRAVRCDTCTTPEETEALCGPSTRVTPCAMSECARDCVVDDWLPWNICSQPCGVGVEIRTRAILRNPMYGGAVCPTLIQERPCTNVTACDSGCTPPAFLPTGQCTASCDGGVQLYTRTLTPTCKALALTEKEYRSCNQQPCAQNCVVGNWTIGVPCTVRCGTGVVTMVRPIVVPPRGTGAACPDLSRVDRCTLKACEPTCTVGEWQNAGTCSKDCGGGKQRQTRAVQCQGCATQDEMTKRCGDAARVIPCNLRACSSDCVMTEWLAWTPCSVACGLGSQSRQRGPVTPTSGIGQACGVLAESRACQLPECGTGQCKYTDWVADGPCSATCDGGTQLFKRTVIGSCTPPLVVVDSRACNTQPCKVDCVLATEPTFTSDCSASCGNGTRQISYAIVTPAVPPGRACGVTDATVPCVNQPCQAPCVVGEWQSTDTCSAQCGGGTRIEVRQVKCAKCATADETARTCGEPTRLVPCNVGACVLDCKTTEWEPWGPCAAVCGTGRRQRTRTVSQQASNGGAQCPVLLDEQPCPTLPACDPCTYTPWLPVGPCSAQCGGGVQGYRRQVNALNATAQCEPDVETRVCNVQQCRVDCVVSDWLASGSCSVPCGTGQQEYTRRVLTSPSGGGSACPVLTTKMDCNTKLCDPICDVGAWSEISNCSVPCGGGTVQQRRSVRCTNCAAGTTESTCGATTRSAPCNTQTCAIDCVMSAWSAWSPCDEVCGNGTATRTRTVVTLPVQGGASCGSTAEYAPCSSPACPTGCIYSPWQNVGQCSAQCGGGQLTQQRGVVIPPGTSCPGATDRSVTCNEGPCPVDCLVGQWASEGACSATCGGGLQTFRRGVLQQSAGAGSPCPALVKQEACNTQSCAAKCSIGSWSTATTCSAACGGGKAQYFRVINCVGCTSADDVLAQCGNTTKTEPCNTQPCPVDCVVSEWSPYTPLSRSPTGVVVNCSQFCGDGVISRTRSVLTFDAYGGQVCPGLIEALPCNAAKCALECSYGPWTSTATCSAECDGGSQVWRRGLIKGTQENCGTLREERPCNTAPCARNCAVGDWVAGECSAKCDGGVLMYTRPILQQPVGSGTACPELVKTETCATAACPPVCTLGEWSDSTKCSAECGGGTMMQRRSVKCVGCDVGTEEARCGPSTQVVVCNLDACPRDCVVSSWSRWSTCGSSCGESIQSRQRQVLAAASAGGARCPSLIEEAPCTVSPCPANCTYGAWVSAGPCTARCGGGTETSTRQVLTGGVQNCGTTTQTRVCNSQPCDVDCVVGSWEPAGPCSVTCGNGTRPFRRQIVTQPVGAGAACPALEKSDACSQDPCAPICTVAPWSTDGACLPLCGGGQRTDTRVVTCSGCGTRSATDVCGPTSRVTSCNTQQCVVDCIMDDWKPWGPCSTTCGKDGIRTRERAILRVASAGGAPCKPTSETGPCEGTLPDCPTECVYTTWVATAQCSRTCGGGEQVFTRTATLNGVPASGQCGATSERRPCNTEECPVDCEVGTWEAEGDCSSKCGVGTTFLQASYQHISSWQWSCLPSTYEDRGLQQPTMPANLFGFSIH